MWRLGWVLFVVVSARVAFQCGTRWKFQDGFPHSLVTPDATFYLDGAQVDPVTAAVIRSSHEPTVYAGFYLFFAVCGVMHVGLAFRRRRLQQRLDELGRLDAAADSQPHAAVPPQTGGNR